MATRQSRAAKSAVNPDAFAHDLIGFAAAGLAVRCRHDIDGVELLIRDGASTEDVVVLAPVQALEVARRLVAAVFELAREVDHG